MTNEQFEEEVRKYILKQTNPVVKIKLLHEKAEIPEYATEGSSGFDFKTLESYKVLAGETILVRTGIAMEIPFGWELQIRPRSGLSLNTKLRIPNSPATIDSDYRDEIKIIIHNSGKYPEIIKENTRIAQGVLCKVPKAIFELVENLSKTSRIGGFGSTGM